MVNRDPPATAKIQTSMKLMTTGQTRNHVLNELHQRDGVKMYRSAKKCPLCGTNNYMRRKDNVCRVCAQKEAEVN